ncbi:ribonuclease HII [Candidatus Woesearchaeota archaeon]|nr:ribonuclease HII [Candidatus Woesearchaeota archaeon]
MVTVCGIDDAGRGPVIGPMIMVGILIDEKDLPKLKTLGVKDSKLLTPNQREKICKEIVKIVKDYKIIKVYPEEIDNAVLSKEGSNLNWLEADKMAEIINYLKPDKVIVDCPSNNIKAFTSYLKNKLNIKTDLKCEHKADFLFLEVGAASILAKCAREEEMESLRKKLKIECGSGYPADPITKEFLKNNWDKYPEIFRHSWSSYQQYSDGKKSKKQKTLGEF